MADLRRDEIGVWITAAGFRLQLTPVLAYPTQPEGLFVRVYAVRENMSFPGQPLHEEKRRGFRFEDISVSETRLECLRQHEFAARSDTAFRMGFCLELEPEAIALLRAWLPPLRRIARVARAIAADIGRTSGRVPTRNEQIGIGRIVSSRVLGGCGADWSVVVGVGWSRWLQMQFDTPSVMALLATCGTDFHTLVRDQVKDEGNGQQRQA